MRIEIIGAESLGVRSLCTVIKTKDRNIVIDPGIALGFKRHGLLPHPVQVTVCEKIRRLIIESVKNATDIVISHYHGDHHPLVNANPYQLSAKKLINTFPHARFWTKGTNDLSANQINRARALSKHLGRILPVAEGKSNGPLCFSFPVPHGEQNGPGGSVMMTKVEECGEIFVHASDIQMLNNDAIDQIIAWKPNIIIASGPPVYLQSLSLEKQEYAMQRTLRLAKKVDTLILDHHLMRSKEGEQWLDHVSAMVSPEHKVICAADFMGIPRNLLEAERVLWYKKLPVPKGWHEAYARGEIVNNPGKVFSFI